MADAEPKYIEIIKPEIIKPEIQGKKETKPSDQNKGNKEMQITDKAIKKKKKDVDPAEAMNSFMQRLAGAESKSLSEERSSDVPLIQEKPKDEKKDKE